MVKDDSRCACYDSINHPQPDGCKHSRAAKIQRTLAAVARPIHEWIPEQPACLQEVWGDDLPTFHEPPAATNGVVQPAAAPEEVPTPLGIIPSRFITQIHGKDFIQYAGLLAMAHDRGLVSLSAKFITVSDDMALAEASAKFEDGKTFMECADASPDNVGAKIRPHFPRMALTRAKARALRDALNISMCSVEEVA